MRTAMVWQLLLAAGTAAAPAGKGLWVWDGDGSPLANASQSTVFWDWVAKEETASTGPIATVFLEGLDHHGPAAFKAALQKAAAANVRVAALYGWNGDGSEGPFPAAGALSFVDDVLAIATSHTDSYTALAGISFDIEPKDKPDPASFQAYATLLPKVRAKLDKANRLRKQQWADGRRDGPSPPLQLSIAGSWGYETHNVSCEAATDVETVPLVACAVEYVDTYILMNYRNNAFGCSCRPKGNQSQPQHRNPAWMQCPASGSPVASNQSGCQARANDDGMIGKAVPSAMAVQASSYKPARLSLGVETSCFARGDWADRRYQYKLSFCGTGTDYLAAQMKATTAGLQTAHLWDGVIDEAMPWSVEDYEALRLLEHHTGLPRRF